MIRGTGFKATWEADRQRCVEIQLELKAERRDEATPRGNIIKPLAKNLPGRSLLSLVVVVAGLFKNRAVVT